MAHVNWNGTQVLHMFTIFFSFLVTSIWHTRSMSKYLNSATSTSNLAHLSQRPPVDRKRTQITPLRPRPSPRIQRPRSRQKTDTNNPTPSDNLQSWPPGPCLGGQDGILSDGRVICVLSGGMLLWYCYLWHQTIGNSRGTNIFILFFLLGNLAIGNINQALEWKFARFYV